MRCWNKTFNRGDCLKYTKHLREVHSIDRHKARHIWKHRKLITRLQKVAALEAMKGDLL